MIADTLLLVVVCFFYGFAHHLFPMRTAFYVCCVNYILDSVISLAAMAANVYVQDISETQDEIQKTVSTGSVGQPFNHRSHRALWRLDLEDAGG